MKVQKYIEIISQLTLFLEQLVSYIIIATTASESAIIVQVNTYVHMSSKILTCPLFFACSFIADAIAKKNKPSRQVSENPLKYNEDTYKDGEKTLETRFNKICTHS